jgi:hypothetical protein
MRHLIRTTSTHLDTDDATPRGVGSDRRRLAAEAGEGVISTAIAVLIMALIGAAMWLAFDQVFRDASGRVTDSVTNIG